MPKTSKNNTSPVKASSEKSEKASHSVELAKRGVKNATDLVSLMSSLITDVVTGAVDPNVSNAACRATGQLLRIVALQYKASKPETDSKISQQRWLSS